MDFYFANVAFAICKKNQEPENTPAKAGKCSYALEKKLQTFLASEFQGTGLRLLCRQSWKSTFVVSYCG